MDENEDIPTIGIKLKLFVKDKEKISGLNKYFDEYSKVATFAAKKIYELRGRFEKLPRKKVEDRWIGETGICAICKQDIDLDRLDKANNLRVCFKCYSKEYGDLAIRKKLVPAPTKGRKVDNAFNVRNAGRLSGTIYHLAVRDAIQIVKATKKQLDKKRSWLLRTKQYLIRFKQMFDNPTKRFLLPKQGKQREDRFIHIDFKDNVNTRGYTMSQIKNKVLGLERDIRKKEKSLSKKNPIIFSGNKIQLHKDQIMFDLDNNKVRLKLFDKSEWFEFSGTNVANKHGIKYFSEKLPLIKTSSYCVLIRKQNKETYEYYLQCPIYKKPEKRRFQTAIGLDRGIDKLATLVVLENIREKPVFVKFFSGKEIIKLKTGYKNFQRLLIGKKNRLFKIKRKRPVEPKINQYLHIVSKELVDIADKNNSIIFAEDIQDIRAKKKAKERRAIRYRLSLGVYRKLLNFIEYKAKLRGLKVELVDPEGTSQKCNNCGSLDTIRPYKNTYSLFRCNNCQKEFNADYNAAVNIGRKGLNMLETK